MRNLVAALLVVGLLAVPSFGTVYVKVVNHADGTAVMNLSAGTPSGVVDILVCGNNDLALPGTNGVIDLAGSVTGTGTGTLTASAWGWDPAVSDLALIPAVDPSAAALGSMSNFGKASLDNASKFVSPTYSLYASYTVTSTGAASVSLNFVNYPDANGLPAGTSGLTHISTDGNDAVDVVVGPPLVVTRSGGPATYVKASIDATGASSAKKTAPRIRNHVFFLYFNQSLVGNVPDATDIKLYKYVSGAWDTATNIFTVAPRTNWKFDVVNDASSQPTVLRIWDVNNTASTLSDKTWYEFTSTGTAKVNAFTVKFVTLRGDMDGSGLVDGNDVTNVVNKLGTAPNMLLSAPAARLNEQRYDYDGTSNVTGTNVYVDGVGPTAIDGNDVTNVVSKLTQTVPLTPIP